MKMDKNAPTSETILSYANSQRRRYTIFLSVVDKFINFHHPFASSLSLRGIRSIEVEKFIQ